MVVAVDHAGKDRRIRKIDDVRTGGGNEPVLHAGNAIVVDEDRNLRTLCFRFAVQKTARVDHDVFCRRPMTDTQCDRSRCQRCRNPHRHPRAFRRP